MLRLRLRTKPSINEISKSINSSVLYRKINIRLGMGKKSIGMLKNGKIKLHASVSEYQYGERTKRINLGTGSYVYRA